MSDLARASERSHEGHPASLERMDESEAAVEHIDVLDRSCLGEPADRDSPTVEEANAAKKQEARVLPSADEADRSLPFLECVGVTVRSMEAKDDRLVAGGHDGASDGVGRLAVVVLEVESNVVSDEVAGEDGVRTGIDESVVDDRGPNRPNNADRDNGSKDGTAQPRGVGVFPVGVEPRKPRPVSQVRRTAVPPPEARVGSLRG